MGNAGKIARNSLVLGVAQGLTKLFSIALTAVAGRVLGTSGYGLYAMGSAVVEVCRVAASSGLDFIVVRDTASDAERGSRTARHAAVLKLCTGVVGYGIGPVAVKLLGYPEPVFFVVLALGAALFLENLSDICDAVFQGHEWMMPSAQAFVLGAAVHFLIGSAVLFAGYGLRGWALSFLSGYLVRFAWLHARAARAGVYQLRLHAIEGAELRRVARAGAPLLGAMIVALLFHRMDILMLGGLVEESQVGLYGAAVRIIDVIVLLPRILATAAYPAMSRTLEREGPQQAAQLVAKSLRLSVVLCATVALGLWILAPLALRWIPGAAFLPATGALRILTWGIALQGAAHMLARLLVSLGREADFLKIGGISLLTNFLLNLWWIPRMGIEGAAWATLVSYVVNVALYYLHAHRGGVRVAARSIVAPFAAILVSATVAYRFPAHGWMNGGNALLEDAARAAVILSLWFVLLFGFGALNRSDIRLFAGELRKKLR
ncbi:MAG TPA: flippase [Candidatus Krumholzibacteria bacterium]|jgi:O-antigen/teichoic acid export membrane protein